VGYAGSAAHSPAITLRGEAEYLRQRFPSEGGRPRNALRYGVTEHRGLRSLSSSRPRSSSRRAQPRRRCPRPRWRP